jgi:hypothetical protein
MIGPLERESFSFQLRSHLPPHPDGRLKHSLGLDFRPFVSKQAQTSFEPATHLGQAEKLLGPALGEDPTDRPLGDGKCYYNTAGDETIHA